MDEIVLTIRMVQATGQTTVSGPIQNKGLCYAMIELARDVIKDYKPQQIIPVAGFQVNPNGGPHPRVP